MKKKNSLLFVFFLLIISISHAQDSIKTIEKISNYSGSQEKYHVRVDNEKVWHGAFRYTYGETLVMEGAYDNDRMDGEWKFYYPSGQLKFDFLFANGKLLLTKGVFYSDGKPACTDSVSGKKGIKRFFNKKSELCVEEFSFNGILIRSTEYFFGTNKIKTVSTRSGEDPEIQEMTSYYENGTTRSVLLKKTGILYEGKGCFDPSGNPVDQGNLKGGTGLLKMYRDTTVLIPLNSIQFQEGKLNGEALFYQRDGKLGIKGHYLDNKPVGLWDYYTNSELPDYEKNADLEYVGLTAAVLEADKGFYDYREFQPSFPGEDEKLMIYLRTQIRYPSKEKDNGVYGTVVMSFTVNTDGIIENIKILKGVKGAEGLDKEAARVVKMMPRWIPGVMLGKPVKTVYNLPISFVLR